MKNITSSGQNQSDNYEQIIWLVLESSSQGVSSADS